MALVRSQQPDSRIEDLQAALAELDAALAARTMELAQARANLDTFRIRYRRDVGRLHEELDELLEAIAEAELKELSDRLKEEGYASSSAPLGRLKLMVDEASAKGKGLVADMVRRLERDIMAARNRLDAMNWKE